MDITNPISNRAKHRSLARETRLASLVTWLRSGEPSAPFESTTWSSAKILLLLFLPGILGSMILGLTRSFGVLWPLLFGSLCGGFPYYVVIASRVAKQRQFRAVVLRLAFVVLGTILNTSCILAVAALVLVGDAGWN